MTALFLAAAIVAAPVDYQVDALGLSSPFGVELSSDVFSCVSSFLPSLWPSEDPDDLISIRYARQNDDRSRACVEFGVERSAPVSVFAEMTTEPSGVFFSDDGSAAYWPEYTPRMCLPRGIFAPLVSCLAGFGAVPGKTVSFAVEKATSGSAARLERLVVSVTGTPAEYGLARRNGIARSHTKE